MSLSLRIPQLILLLLPAVFLGSGVEAQQAVGTQEKDRPPHILFFIVDDLGWQDTAVSLHEESAPFQKHYRTPHLQRLAREGLVFTNAYASSPVCTPTRTSIMTGRSPQANGITYWILHKDRDMGGSREGTVPPKWQVNGLQPGDITLPGLLSKNGYRTIHAGKAHLGAHGSGGADPLKLGFDVNIAGHAAGAPSDFRGSKNFARDPEHPGAKIWDVPGLEKYHGKETYLTEALALEAATAIHQAHQDGERFFLHFSPYAVHTPIIANKRHLDDYADLPKVEALKDKMGWAPTYGSHADFVTCMRYLHGDEKTLQWLKDMKAAGVKSYAKESKSNYRWSRWGRSFTWNDRLKNYFASYRSSDRNFCS